MKLTLISIGKVHDPLFREAIDDFTIRIGHYMPVEWKIFKEEDGVDDKILKTLGEGDYVVALDERGKETTSLGLADLLAVRLNASTRQLVFVIGGAYGLSPKIIERAKNAHGSLISLSKMTFPHQLVRLILAEQLYRACSIMKGEKYHHQ